MVDIRDCGAHATSEPGYRHHDSTGAIRDALAAGDVITIPAGTWLVSQIVVVSGKTVRTRGMSTVVRQLPASMPDKPGEPNSNFPMVLVQGSNVELGTFKAIGNIAADVGEWNHAVLIASAAGPISHIRLGDVFGQDIRGDVVMIDGGEPGLASVGPVSDVAFGTVTGDNVLRSMMSINGGVGIAGVAVGDRATGGHCGYRTLDIEPNHWNQAPDAIVIGEVVGGNLQLASADLPNKIIGTVTLGVVDLASSRQKRPSPEYVADSTKLPYFDQSVGIIASGWTRLRIGELRISGKARAAIMAPMPARAGESVLEIGRYRGTGNATDPAAPYPEIHCVGCGKLRIEGGSSSLPKPVAGAIAKYLVAGGPSLAGTVTEIEISNFTLRGGGAFAAGAAGGFFRNIVVLGSVETPETAALFIDVSDSVLDAVQVAGERTLLHKGARNVLLRTKLSSSARERDRADGNVVIGAP